MSAAPAPGRVPCPVLRCTNDTPAGQVMCSTCWMRVPRYTRIAVDATLNACRRQNTKANQTRHHAAKAAAIQVAAEYVS